MARFFSFLLITAFAACTYDKAEQVYPLNTCNTDSVRYSVEIQDIFVASCYVCHNSASNPLGSGISLQPHSEAQNLALDGVLLCSVKQEVGCSAMPKNGGKLDDCAIQQIEIWINDGAPNN